MPDIFTVELRSRVSGRRVLRYELASNEADAIVQCRAAAVATGRLDLADLRDLAVTTGAGVWREIATNHPSRM